MTLRVVITDASSGIGAALAREYARRYVVLPWQMGVVGALLKTLPRSLYDRLLAKAPGKPLRSV